MGPPSALGDGVLGKIVKVSCSMRIICLLEEDAVGVEGAAENAQRH
jgi:hypothetical protein